MFRSHSGIYHYHFILSCLFPSSEEEWIDRAKNFDVKWNFPNCLGIVDGKHVRISPLAGSGSFCYNYKGYNRMVLLAIANANYEFIMVDFGTQRSHI